MTLPPTNSAPLIRPIQETDAENFLALGQALDHETRFMMLEPGERTASVEAQRERIRAGLAQENSTILVAEAGGQLVGYAAAYGGAYRRNRHSAHVVCGILQAWTGQGLGRRLFTALIDWAAGCGLHRLELTVMAHNQGALALYQKMGFQIEGLRRHSLWVDQAWVDEYAMARLIE